MARVIGDVKWPLGYDALIMMRLRGWAAQEVDLQLVEFLSTATTMENPLIFGVSDNTSEGDDT